MRMIPTNGILTHVVETGAPDGQPVVFSNSLGTDVRVWDKVVARLPPDWRIIRYDNRGHGLTEAPKPPYGMGDLVSDAAAVMDALDVRGAVFVGLSIGGLIGQGLAAERPDLVRGLVLSNTGAKIGTETMWQDRIDAIQAGGIAALEGAILERWFSKTFHSDHTEELAGWRAMLTRTPVAGYVGCSQAIMHTDLWESTARLTLPALGIAGTEDGSTPVDMVRETLGLIPGSRVHVVQGVGHLPCVEAPDEVAREILAFAKTL